MSNDFDKQASTSLGGATGEIPTTIKLLAQALDKKFEADEIKATERHTELLNAITTMKKKVETDCDTCRANVNKKFEMLRIWFVLVENPKLRTLIIALVVVVAFLVWRGGEDVVKEAAKLFTSVIK